MNAAEPVKESPSVSLPQLGANHQPLRQVVTDALRKAILSKQLRPGERLVEEQLAADLGVSRNPVREALRVLESEGLVEISPRRGASVTSVSEEEAQEIVEVRAALEGLCARLAARRCTPAMKAEIKEVLDRGERAAAVNDAPALAGIHSECHALMARAGHNRHLAGFVQSLRDKSLLRTFQAAGATSLTRFAFYESIREFAAEKLALSGDRGASARHAAYFVTVGGDWAAGVERRGRPADLQRLVLDLDNLLAAHAWALAAKDTETRRQALAAMLAMEPALQVGPSHRHLSLLDATLAASADDVSVERARLLVMRAEARRQGGLVRESRADAEAAMTAGKRTGDRWTQARSLLAEAMLEAYEGRAPHAHELAEDALEMSRTDGDRTLEGLSLLRLGFVWCQEGETERARAAFEQSYAAYGELGNQGMQVKGLGNLAALLQGQGRLEEARPIYERALAMSVQAHDEISAAITMGNLAAILQEQGLHDEARESYTRALAILRRNGVRSHLAYFTSGMGTLLHEQGQLHEAEQLYEQATALLSGGGRKRDLLLALVHLGAARADLGHTQAAAETLTRAESMLESVGEPNCVAAVRVLRAHLHLAHARDQAAAGDSQRAQEERRLAQSCLLSPEVVDATNRLDDVRCALRIFGAALARDSVKRTPDAATAGSKLTVGPAGRWFRVGNWERTELPSRRALRRLLIVLAEQRLEAPGKPVSVEALLHALYPGERFAVARSGALRIRQSVSRLRALGLRDQILSDTDGYLFDPALPLELER